MRVIVAQTGAREHYAAASALHEQRLLAALVTDWYATKLVRRVGGMFNGSTKGMAALAARCEGIPDELVHSFPFRSLLWKRQVCRLAAGGMLYEAYAQTDAAFAAAVSRLHLPAHEVFFGYSYASLEMLEAEKQRGVVTILDQIDPGPAEFRLVAEEMATHPDIAGPPMVFPVAHYERNRHEWEIADVIIVNSEWSKQALVTEGVDPAKIEILPLAYDRSPTTDYGLRTTGDGGQKPEVGDQRSVVSDQWSHQPLRVLWLGQVNVRKGIHYLMQAARMLEGENIQFDVVGPIGILPGAVASAPRNMTFHGPVSRDRAAEWYQKSDVFVLPTLSDGFALTQLEALAHGLPVITTPNCGRVVEPGKTGFMVPPRDPCSLADAILEFVHDDTLSARMGPACSKVVDAFSLKAFGTNLVNIIDGYRSAKASA